MAYENKEVQPELFRFKDRQKKSTFRKPLFFSDAESKLFIGPDVAIITVISVLMINLIVFATGIERGKKLAMLEVYKSSPRENSTVSENREVVRARVETVPPVEEKSAITGKIPVEAGAKEVTVEKAEAVPVNEKLAPGHYLIQLVTYSSDKYANREAAELQAAGYSALVQKKGEYYVLYAGSYEDRETAAEKMSALKKRYKDCLIREI